MQSVILFVSEHAALLLFITLLIIYGIVATMCVWEMMGPLSNGDER